MAPDNEHRKNLVASSTLRTFSIHQKEYSDPHGSKPVYTVSNNSFTERSHYEENIENYILMNELSNE